jgi:hypothetical protein
VGRRRRKKTRSRWTFFSPSAGFVLVSLELRRVNGKWHEVPGTITTTQRSRSEVDEGKKFIKCHKNESSWDAAGVQVDHGKSKEATIGKKHHKTTKQIPQVGQLRRVSGGTRDSK